MKKFLTTLFAVLFVVGAAASIGGASDAMVAIKGDTIQINESVQSDFDKKAMAEGEIYYVYDCIATEEVTHTRYGVKTGTDETNFYLIESYNKDWFNNGGEDYTPLTLIYATADEEKIAQLDSMVEDWANFYDDYETWYYDESSTEDDFPAFPEQTFTISGIITEYDDDKLYEYRDEYLSDYITSDVDSYVDSYCVDMIIKDTDVQSAKNAFFAAIAIAVIGLIGLIATLVLFKKKKNEQNEETINESNDGQIL
jgi:hypothetical protein